MLQRKGLAIKIEAVLKALACTCVIIHRFCSRLTDVHGSLLVINTEQPLVSGSRLFAVPSEGIAMGSGFSDYWSSKS